MAIALLVPLGAESALAATPDGGICSMGYYCSGSGTSGACDIYKKFGCGSADGGTQ